MKKWKEMLRMVPTAPNWRIDWRQIEASGLGPLIEKMKITLQNPIWHGEGDVWTHTRMVCEKLVSLEEYRSLERRKQEEVFLGALLHDIGKIPCTRMEDGRWTSPNHTAVGARMARELLWLEYGFCGAGDLKASHEAGDQQEFCETGNLQKFRETVCMLIRYHSIPLHILDQKNPELRLIKIAANGELIPDFSIALLCILVKADIQGRISDSLKYSLEILELCAIQAEETGCLKHPFPFPTEFSGYVYMNGRNIMPGQEFYDDTWGQVILMGGLPGTGKDTWIKEHCGNCPVVSLDHLRKQMKIFPTDAQGTVINAAREMAKGYMRNQVPFIWNATNLTPMLREKQVRLFTDYNASVRIVFLETGWEEQMKRNKGRKEQVPEPVIRGMMRSMVLPERYEAHQVEWRCT